jgi:hypothetical protein
MYGFYAMKTSVSLKKNKDFISFTARENRGQRPFGHQLPEKSKSVNGLGLRQQKLGARLSETSPPPD